MRQLIDQLRKTNSPIVVLLGTRLGDSKVTFVAGLSRDLVERGFSAGDLVRETARDVGGSGGGKPDMAQAGGKQPEKLEKALSKARERVSSWLTQ